MEVKDARVAVMTAEQKILELLENVQAETGLKVRCIDVEVYALKNALGKEMSSAIENVRIVCEL